MAFLYIDIIDARIGSTTTITSPESYQGSHTFTAGSITGRATFSYGTIGVFSVMITVTDSDVATIIAVHDLKDFLADVSPTETQTFMMYASPGGSAYKIHKARGPVPPRWSFYSVSETGVECSIYIKPSGQTLYSQYFKPKLTANFKEPFLYIPFSTAPTGSVIGVLVPGQFLLYDNTGVVPINPDFAIISSTTVPNADSIGYAEIVGGIAKRKQLNPGNGVVDFSSYTTLGTFYIIPRGRYNIIHSDPGKQAKAEADQAAKEAAATLATVQTVLSIVSKGASIVKDVALTASSVANIVK